MDNKKIKITLRYTNDSERVILWEKELCKAEDINNVIHQAELDIVCYLPRNNYSRNNFWIKCDEEKSFERLFTIPLDAIMEALDILLIYNDAVLQQSACSLFCIDGIDIMLHTSEEIHRHKPHIHASYSGQDIFIQLDNFKVIGKFKNPKQQKRAIEWIKDNKEYLYEQWNNLMDGKDIVQFNK